MSATLASVFRKGRTYTLRSGIGLLLHTADAFVFQEPKRDEATCVADKIVDSDNFL